MSSKPTDPVDVYRCSSCGRLTIVARGNHHPWCGCSDDRFDWADGIENVSREEAERILKEDKP